MNDELPSLGRVMAWIFFATIGCVLFFGFLGVATGIVSLPFRVAGQANRIIDKTIDADNVIYNYEWFKQQCQDLKAQQRKIENAAAELAAFEASAGQRSSWDYMDKQEHARLTANLTGAKSVDAEMVARYNARARMMNRSLFNTEPCDVQVTR